MSDRPALPSTWIPTDPYRGPANRAPGVLKLDGNEGGALPRDVMARLALEDSSVIRDYPHTAGLEADIAAWLQVDSDRVVVTAGADDALDRICRAYLRPGRRIVLPVPCFEMMYRFVAATGGEAATVPWEGDFPTDAVLSALEDDVAVVAIISPNNPTGRVATAADLIRVAETAQNAIVLLDHVYVDYADEDLTELATEIENVVTVRSFSKAWGLAGCRVGYAIASSEVAGVIRNAGNPFPVAGLSISAVRGRLAEGPAPLEEHVQGVRSGRRALFEVLNHLGVEAIPSQGNFVFADFGDRAPLVHHGLAALGIAVRRFPHRPEIATGIRISVPLGAEEMDTLQAALETILAPQALLFDLDGVLADVEGSYRRCVLETVGSYGVSANRTDLETAVLAGDANNDWVLTQRILAALGVEADLQEVTARFQELYLGTAKQPGLRESERLLVDRRLLERMRSRMPLAIVTGRPRAEATWFLDRSGISGLFDAVVCLEDGPLKPNPEPVRIALSLLSVQKAWMVGDTPDDLRAAQAAAVLPVGIVAPGDDPANVTAGLRAAGAATVLNDLSHLEGLLP